MSWHQLIYESPLVRSYVTWSPESAADLRKVRNDRILSGH
jgi:hypothetical protein